LTSENRNTQLNRLQIGDYNATHIKPQNGH